MFGLDDDRPRSKSSREKDKDKSKDRDGDKSSHGVSLGPGSTAKDGSWRRVTATLRDDGYFRVFSEVSDYKLLTRRESSLIQAYALRRSSSCTRFTSRPCPVSTSVLSTGRSLTTATASSFTGDTHHQPRPSCPSSIRHLCLPLPAHPKVAPSSRIRFISVCLPPSRANPGSS